MEIDWQKIGLFLAGVAAGIVIGVIAYRLYVRAQAEYYLSRVREGIIE